MDHDERYFRALETALGLVAFARERPDAPDYVLVAHFIYTLLAAIACEEELAARPLPEPSAN